MAFFFSDGSHDIIARDGATLVFVEVRSRKNTEYGHPLDSITPQKQHHIIKAATLYLIKKQIYDKIACRFDVVALSTQENQNNQLVWILRPFIGLPNLPVEFLRPNAFQGNFFETVFHSVIELFTF